MKSIFIKLTVYYFIFIGGSFTFCSAQNTREILYKGKIVGLGKAYPGKISLRWNTNNYQVFKTLAVKGVVIDRMVLNKNNKAEGSWQRVTKDTVRALPLAGFNRPEILKDSGKVIIAECLYGTPTATGSNFLEKVRNQDEELQNKHLFASLYATFSPDNAAMAGLGYDDIFPVDSTKKYVYRLISCAGEKYTQIDTGFVFVMGVTMNGKEKVMNTFAEGLDSKIMLRIPADENHFNAFYFEHSIDNKTFVRLNETPYLAKVDTINGKAVYVYIDSVKNNIPYYYRITGINSFGERVTSNGQMMITATAKDMTPPKPLNLKYKMSKNHVAFSWEKSTDKDLKQLYLVEGISLDKIDSVYTKEPLSPTTVSYSIELDPYKFSAGYFRLLELDTAKNYSYSNCAYIFLPDKIPPKQPVGLTGSIDSLGVVTLKWDADHSEALRGYKVMFCNNERQSFVPLTNIFNDTTYTYTTTMQTLTKDIYFRVVAFDGSYNVSQPSQIIQLKRPLKIKPVTPVFLDFYAGKNSVRLKWSNSSNPEDFSRFILYRKASSEPEWTQLATTAETQYVDTLALPGKTYDYTVQEVTRQNMYSEKAIALTAHMAASEYIPHINFTVIKNDVQKKYELKWNNPDKEVNFYIIYKDEGEGLITYQPVPANIHTFTEPMIDGKKLKFGIKINFKDNSQSEVIKEP